MLNRGAGKLVNVILATAILAPLANAYIHFPPMTLQKMTQMSHHIRVLKVKKFSKEKGVIIFEVAESLKGEKSRIRSFKHVIGVKGEGAKRILDWAKEGKYAVIFYIESISASPIQALGYVFIEEYCYSVGFNAKDGYWMLIRGEPDMSECYFGSAEKLGALVKNILNGKPVEVPVRKPDKKEDAETRRKEVNDALEKNRR